MLIRFGELGFYFFTISLFNRIEPFVFLLTYKDSYIIYVHDHLENIIQT